MTVLDAYAVIAYLGGERAAPKVRLLLDAGGAALTAVGVADVIDHLVRLVGVDEEDAALDLAQLGLLEGLVVDVTIGIAAGRLRARHYHRTRCAISMADCIGACSARVRAEPLATSDSHLLDVCQAEGITTVVLPGSDGSLWAPSI